MDDIFTNEIHGVIDPPHETEFPIVGTKVTSNKDIQFISKWTELFERYSSARMFLRKTQEKDWSYWFNPIDDQALQKVMEDKFKADIYETALINYNIIVDLSWALTYISSEYIRYELDDDGKTKEVINTDNMQSIEVAYGLIREMEKDVVTPNTEGNPYEYLKKMSSEFSEAITLMMDFWKKFAGSDIRNLYNYIKHRGKPFYEEIENFSGGKPMKIFSGGKEYSSSIRDVKKIVSLEKGINRLIEFDNNELFPYIERLLVVLKKGVDPSPMAFM